MSKINIKSLLFKVLILLFFSIKLNNCIENDDDDDPFELTYKNSPKLSNNNNINVGDDDPFTLVSKGENKINLTEQELKNDFLLHLHLIKILWNKIIPQNHTTTTFSNIDVLLRLKLSEKMIQDIQIYINSSNVTFSTNINQYFLHNLQKEEEKSFSEFKYGEKSSFFEHSYVQLAVFLVFVAVLVKKPWQTVISCLVWALWHEASNLEDERALKQQFELNKALGSADYCKGLSAEASGFYGYIKSFFYSKSGSKDTCFEHYKTINSKTTAYNPVKVFAELWSNTIVVLLRPIGEIIGVTYRDLNKHMPFFMAYITLFIGLFIMAFICVAFFYVYLKVPAPPVVQQLPIEQPIEQQNGYRRRREVYSLNRYTRKLRQMINYR